MEKINQVQTQRLRVIEGLSINYDSILYVDLDTDKVLPYRLNSRTEPAFGKRFQPLSYHQFIAEYLDTWIHPMDRETFARVMDPEYICQKLSEQNTYYINFRIVDGNEVQCLQLCLVNTDTNHHVSRIIVGSRRVDQEIQHEMEQKQILEQLRANEETQLSAAQIQSALEMADFVKFAAVKPLPDDNIKTYNTIYDFVESTKPVPTPEEEAEAAKSKKKK